MKQSKFLGWLFSLKLALVLIFLLSALAALGTISTAEKAEIFLGQKIAPVLMFSARLLGLVDTFRSPLFFLLLILLSLNIILCTADRFRRRRLSWAQGTGGMKKLLSWLDLILHLSIIVILAGGAVKARWGFLATQYLFEGYTVERVYDWRENIEVPLDFQILLKERKDIYYPLRLRVKITLTEDEDFLGRLEISEGKESKLPGHDLYLEAGGFDQESLGLWLEARTEGKEERFALELRQGGRTSADFTPYRIDLMDYRRDLKRVESRVAIIEDGREVMEGVLSPNSWVNYRGTSIFQTSWGTDPYGFSFIGIQISRDPGAPFFWTGCLLISFILPTFLYLKHGHRH